MSGGGFVDETVDPPTVGKSGSKTTENDVLLTLTPRQETRLCAHLDDRLLGLERDERKQ
jgi:hypothetical protein